MTTYRRSTFGPYYLIGDVRVWDKDIDEMALKMIYFEHKGTEGYNALREMIYEKVSDFEAYHIVQELVLRRTRELIEKSKHDA